MYQDPPVVSYIVPVYNKAPFLPYTLGALQEQKGDFTREFIFVDDGSTDDSAQIIHDVTREWQNVYYVYQDNKGPAVATNRGIAQAQGHWIKLVDADDMLLPYGTLTLLQAASLSNKPVIFGDRAVWTTQEDILEHWRKRPLKPHFHEIKEDLLTIALRGMPVHTASAMLVQRDVLEAIKGCDERVFVQDYSLFLRLCHYSTWAWIENCVVLHPAAHLEQATRVSQWFGQEHHDLNAALYWFFKEHPDLPKPYIRQAALKATGRARKYHDSYLVSLCQWLRAHRRNLSTAAYLDLIQRSLAAFDSAHIKVPISASTDRIASA